MGQNAWTRLKPDGLATQNKKGLTISYSNWEKLIFQEKFYKNFYIAIPPFWARYFNNRNSKLLEIRAYGNYTSRNFWKYQIQSQSSSQRPLNKSPKIGSKKRKNQIVDKYKFVFFLVFFLNIKKKKKIRWQDPAWGAVYHPLAAQAIASPYPNSLGFCIDLFFLSFSL